MITRPLEMQPEFPAVDLTVANADTLQLMLANRQVATEYHGAAEAAGPLFRVLHPAIDNTIGFPSSAVSHGTMIFEAIHAAVTSATVSEINSTRAVVAVSNPSLLRSLGSRVGVLGLADEFRKDMPRTAETIVETFPRQYTADPAYLLAGAAIERTITMRALSLR